MLLRRLFTLLCAIVEIIACPDHGVSKHDSDILRRAGGARDWNYDASHNWGSINKNYTLCQTGTNQSPIELYTTQSLSRTHTPTFNYSSPVSGMLYNWGYGPAFTLNYTSSISTITSPLDLSQNPSLTYDSETVFLKGWHVHSPAEHIVDGRQSRSELHLVHSNREGEEKVVVSIRIDPFVSSVSSSLESYPSFTSSPFLTQFIAKVPHWGDSANVQLKLDMSLVLQEVGWLKDGYWTYEGSLTSPPCREDIRWFVVRRVLVVGREQMRGFLGMSRYGARVTQKLWDHGLGA